jgi:hypothetical protein
VERTYAPRTVAIVALASLVLGFLVVFGGGMLLLRPKIRSHRTEGSPQSVGGFADDASGSSVDAGSMAGPLDDDATPNAPASNNASATATAPASGGEPTQSAGITIGPASISRCFNPGPPTPIRGADCDRLTDLDRHVSSHATQLAACARAGAHGRLSLLLDFRFSTSYATGWGLPTSNIPNPGNVAACAKSAILPLPYSSMHHEHDRYVVVIPIDW